MIDNRFFSGNSARRTYPKMHAYEDEGSPIPRIPRRLVEECISISVSDIKYRLGRKALLVAVRDARPVRFQVAGASHEVYLCYESHRLPGRFSDWSEIDEGNVRLWLVCLGCRRRVRKLYCYPVSNGARQMSDVRCRPCHGLVYQSQNCGGNRWWRDTAKPLKRLLVIV